MAQSILLVDDDPTQRRLLQAVIEREGYRVLQAEDGAAALALLLDGQGGEGGKDVDLMILDLVMPDMDGMAVMEALRPKRPELPVIVLTAKGGIDTVVQAMQAGAVDFFVKPASPERIHVSIKNALSLTSLKDEVSRLKRKEKGELNFHDLIGASEAMAEVARLGRRAAASTIPILIEGESGVGKELVARAIQGESDRAGRPFITVNCGAIPENLVESILFGHEKGSFTGAAEKHIGKFREADGGTLFLDEVGELPADMQVKLLRALQEGEIDPVGGKRPVKVDVRIISATNRDLLGEVKAGRFREDLYYRLSVYPMRIPPLRERACDIPALVEHFISRYNAEEGKQVRGIDERVLNVLCAQHWQGNVRQLENAIFRAVVLAEGAVLTADDFPYFAAEFKEAGVDPETAPQLAPASDPRPAGDRISQNAAAAGDPFAPDAFAAQAAPGVNPAHDAAPGAPATPSAVEMQSAAGVLVALDRDGQLRTLEAVERDLIQLAIDTYNGQMSEVARRLGIGRSTLYRKVREQGIDVKRAS